MSQLSPCLNFYSKRPYLFLAPFKDLVAGFIFEDGSNLCHLSLILRESLIPAISLEGKRIEFDQGEIINLNANEGIIELAK